MPWKCSRTALNVCSNRRPLSRLIVSINSSSCCLDVGQVGDLRREELLALLQLVLLADRVEVDVAEPLDLLAELLDLLGDRVPVHVGRLVAGPGVPSSAGAESSAYCAGRSSCSSSRCADERLEADAESRCACSSSPCSSCSTSACGSRYCSTSRPSVLHRLAGLGHPAGAALRSARRASACCSLEGCLGVPAPLPARASTPPLPAGDGLGRPGDALDLLGQLRPRRGLPLDLLLAGELLLLDLAELHAGRW